MRATYYLRLSILAIFLILSLGATSRAYAAACVYVPNTVVSCGSPNVCEGCNLVNDNTYCQTDANANPIASTCYTIHETHQTNASQCSSTCAPPVSCTGCSVPAEPDCTNIFTYGLDSCGNICDTKTFYGTCEAPTSTPAPTPPPGVTPTPTPPPSCPAVPVLTPLISTACDATQVTLSWAAVPYATGYDVRVDGQAGDVPDSRNNCSPHMVCINGFDVPANTVTKSITINVLPGHSYNWWVHSSSPACGQSGQAISSFAIPVCPTATPPPGVSPTIPPVCPVPAQVTNVTVECAFCQNQGGVIIVPAAVPGCAASDGCQYNASGRKTGIFCTGWDGLYPGNPGYNSTCVNPNVYFNRDCKQDSNRCAP